jgi:hypothetical protein
VRLRGVRFAVAPLAVLMLALPPATSAAAQPEPFVEIEEPIEVNAQSELELSVVSHCTSSLPGSPEGLMRVRVEQRKHAAEVSRPVLCDGEGQAFIEGLRGFRKGHATVSATLEVPGGGSAQATREIDIVRQPTVFVKIERHAVLLPPEPPSNGGEPENKVGLTVEYRCIDRLGFGTEGRMFVGVSQGTAFSTPIFGVKCDGQTQRETFDVYQPLEPWHTGKAVASARTEPNSGTGGASSGPVEINIE